MKRDVFPLVFGVLVSTLLAGTLVMAGLKAGITPGVSPLVILFAWGAFNRRIAAGGGSRFLNIAQVAGSAGMAVTAGVIFTAPLLQILHEQKGLPVPPVDYQTLMLLSFAGALIGFGFVGLGTRKFLLDPTLPAPEARACETMIEAAVSDPDKRPRLIPSLYAGLIASFVAPLLTRMGLANEHVVLLKRTQGDDREFQFDLPFTPIYLGIGGLLTLATALLVFGGTMLRLIGDFGLASIVPGGDTAELFPANSMRWVGGGAMTVAVAYSLKRFFGIRSGAAAGEGDPLVEIDPSIKRWLWLSILAGATLLIGWLFFQDGATPFAFSMSTAIILCVSLMVILGAILSLQIGSSASPVSGTVFVTTLVMCLVALAVGRREISDVLLLTPLLVGACVAVCTANDSSQDYKTMQLCGVRVQEGFLAQILGLTAGCIVVPIVLYIAHDAFTLGSDALPAPQGQMFATLIDGLLLEENLPWYPIFIGLAVGVFAVGMDILGEKRGIQLPAMALAVGIYLPPYLGVGILMGSLFRFFAEGKGKQTNESILAAAGLITGAALLELILGIGIVFFKLDVNSLILFPEVAADGSVATTLSNTVLNLAAIAGILVLGGILYFNSKRRAA